MEKRNYYIEGTVAERVSSIVSFIVYSLQVLGSFEEVVKFNI